MKKKKKTANGVSILCPTMQQSYDTWQFYETT